MKELSESELREKIEFSKQLITDSFENIEDGNVPEENLAGAYRMIAGNYHSIGLCQGLLNDPDSARQSFASAAEYQLKGLDAEVPPNDSPSVIRETYPIPRKKLLDYAVLSLEDGLIETATSRALTLDEAYLDTHPNSAHRYHEIVAYGKILRGDDASEPLERFEQTLDPEFFDDVDFQLAVSSVMHGLNDQSRERISTGLTELLNEHSRTVNEKSANSLSVLCKRAIALATASSFVGTPVWPDSTYVPAALAPELE